MSHTNKENLQQKQKNTLILKKLTFYGENEEWPLKLNCVHYQQEYECRNNTI